MEKGFVLDYFGKGWCVAFNSNEAEVDCWEASNWKIPEDTFTKLGYACNGKRYEHEFVYNEGTSDEDHKIVYDTYFENKEDAEHFLKVLRIVSVLLNGKSTEQDLLEKRLEDLEKKVDYLWYK